MNNLGLRDVRFISPNAFSYGSINGRKPNIRAIEELLEGIRGIIGPKGRIFFGTFPSEVRPEFVSEDILEVIKKYVNKFLNAFCLAPFCSLGVDALGNVGRCAAAYRHSSPVNLRGKSIREVWYGEFFEAARKLMLEGKPLGKECKTCGIINQRFIMRSRLAALIGEKKPKIRTHPWGHEIISE